MSEPIRLEALSRTYGARRGVSELRFHVERGEVFGFLGPNGAGKTTTMRMLMGLLKPTGGRATIFGLDCWTQSVEVKKRVGFLPGDIRVYDELTGAQLLDLFAGLRGGVDAKRRAALCARLDAELGVPLSKLSKGNRQKVVMVQALMHDPELIILDEPTSGLDPLVQRTFQELLLEEKARGKTIFLSSHVLQEVDRLADRVAILRGGKLVAVEPISALKAVQERRMELTLRGAVERSVFERVPGVRVQDELDGGTRYVLGVKGEPLPLLRVLGELPVGDVTFAPADLEGIFMHYYGDAAPTEGEAQSSTKGGGR